MKKLFLFITALLLIACNKSDDNNDFKTPLPEPTQNGAVMFACYVDGKAYIAKGYNQVNSLYQWANDSYHFGIHADFNLTKNEEMTIGTEAPYKELIPGNYKLSKYQKNNFSASISFLKSGSYFETSRTNSEYTGELTITKLDMENEIVSGTFWFDIENPLTGERIKVREGRFDTHFSQ